MGTAKKRVVILGGGVGAMTTAFELSNAANRDNYDITVYQMGWRLGGQGASGRNRQKANRIEEHGLHAWGGFYENAFRVMRECYEELGRTPGQPLARIWDPQNPDATDVAFKPHDNVVFCEFIQGNWIPWSFPFVTQPGLPGMPGNPLPGMDLIVSHALRSLLAQFHIHCASFGIRFTEAEDALIAAIARVLGIEPPEPPAKLKPASEAPEGFLTRLRDFGEKLADEIADHVIDDVRPLAEKALPHFIDWLKGLGDRLQSNEIVKLCENDTAMRRTLITLDFTRVLLVGAFSEDLFVNGFDPLEGVDFSDWLKKYGAMQITLDSVLVRGFYDYMFAFQEGDPGRPLMSAGMALYHALRLTSTYHGGVFWLMQAGMGDTVFAPFYLVLKRRGVKFHFFHRVDDIVASADTKEITSIALTQQVKLKGGEDAEYNPLIPVKGLECWPSEPLWDEIEYGAQMEKMMGTHDLDFESPYYSLPPDLAAKSQSKVTLRAGTDFDLVISNISVAALRTVSAGLLAANPRLSDIFEKVQTIETMAVQVWFRKSFAELGWNDGQPVLTGYERPNSTWGAMTHLLDREEWEVVPEEDRPKALGYFCGPFYDPYEYQGLAPFQEWMHSYQTRVEAVARQWFQDNARGLFPKAAHAGNPTALCYGDLCLSNAVLPISPQQQPLLMGLARFNDQYFRGNCNPCDRYVIALPGDSRYRPREGESGIRNLYFVGDWIYTGLGGCVESAAMSALMVARRLTGSPEVIPGELAATRLGYQPPQAKATTT